MRYTARAILGLFTVLAALHFVHAYQVRGLPNDFGQCAANAPPF